MAASPDHVELSMGGTIDDMQRQFIADAERIKLEISRIKSSTKEAASLSQKMLMAVSDNQERKAGAEVEQLMDSTKVLVHKVKKKLERMKQDTQTLEEQKDLTAQRARIRNNLHNALMAKFLRAFEDFKNAQEKYSGELKGKVRRQVKIIQPDASDEFIEDVMQTEGGVQKFYEEAIVKRTAASEVVNSYQRAVERYDEARKLEEAVKELSQMFLDMAILVEQQGQLIDNIEDYISEALEDIEIGNDNLEETIKLQKSIKKRQCCIIVIIICVVLAVLLPMVLQD